MKNSVSIVLTLAVSLFSVSSAFAAASEPANGFVKGTNPEWSAAHTTSNQSDPAHRVYHKNAEGERVLWLQQNAAAVGTPDYRSAERAFLRLRNLAHRQWHLDASGIDEVQSSTQGVQLRIFSTTVEVTIVALPTDNMSVADRSFTGPVPSRRSIIEAAENMKKIHAVTIGY